nr:RluA family pseudouridine synthase [Rossellomorea aquimaris]
MKPYSLEWIVDSSYEGKLLREFLIDQQISKRTLTSVKFDGGLITVNGKEVNVRYVLHERDFVKITFPKEVSSDALVGKEFPLTIVYEDNDVLIIDKDWGIPSIPTNDHDVNSLAAGIYGYYQRVGISSTVHIVTRLDKDTSGLILIAKHRHVHHLFSLQQKDRRIQRSYEAIAQGKLLFQKGTIEAPIGRKDDSIIEREVREDGQPAITHYDVLKQYKGFAHVQLKLETGRTHQIRVHMSSIGHPLVGDDLYGGDLNILNRQALHCRSLAFFHPIKRIWMSFSSMLPEDMKNLLDGR